MCRCRTRASCGSRCSGICFPGKGTLGAELPETERDLQQLSAKLRKLGLEED
jgi:hypothetical protein